MDIFFFLLFAATTVFLSIKISKDVDAISKKSNTKGYILLGILLASITSLPELVTSITAVRMNNPYLAVGDVIGSNTFNIFMMCVIDIIFAKDMIFKKTKKDILEYVILIAINITIIMYLKLHLTFSLPSIVIFILYIVYIFHISSNKKVESKENGKVDTKEILNLVFVSFFLLLSSVMLTQAVNNISIKYPTISSSVLGAIMLGITTSLPEVITFMTLVKLNNYDMALADILGSNIFNFLVLGVNDLLVKNPIYFYMDKGSILLINISSIITIINAYQNMKKPNKKVYYSLSILIILLYLFFGIKGFYK